MNVPTKLFFTDNAKKAFKEKAGKLPQRLNIKVWVAELVSEALGTEVTVMLSTNQQDKLKKDAKKKPRNKTTSEDKPISVVKGTTPTMFKNRGGGDEPKRKKFTLSKK